MKRKIFYQKIITTMSDPILVAEAYSDFYTQVYQKQLKISSYIVDDTQPLSEEYDGDIVTLVQEDGLVLFVRANSAKEQMLSYFAHLDNDPSYDQLLSLEQVGGLSPVTMYVDDLIRMMGESCDSTFIVLNGFKAVANDGNVSADHFINTMNLNMETKTQQSIQTIGLMYDTLDDESLTTSAKLDFVTSFTGVNLFTDSPSSSLDIETDLSQFTGISPIGAWLSGFDINWNSIIGVMDGVIQASAKLITNAVSIIGDSIGKVFSWLASKVSTTFINPIDYECSDDSLEFFNVAGRAKYHYTDVSLYGTTQNNLFYANEYHERIMDSNPFWIQYGGVAHKVVKSIDPLWNNAPTFYVERFIKPLNVAKIFNILKNLGDDAPTHRTKTFRQFLNCLYELQTSDLSCSNDDDELQVFFSLAASMGYSKIVSDTVRRICDHLKNNDSRLEEEIDLDEPMLPILDTSTIEYFFQINIHTLYQFSKHASRSLEVELESWGIQVNNSLQVWSDKTSVTNADFINLLTSFSAINENGLSENKTFADVDSDGFILATKQSSFSDSNMITINAITSDVPFFVTACATEIAKDINDNGTYCAYRKGRNLPSLYLNVRIKTDNENAAAVGKALTTALLTISTAAISVGAIVAFLKVRRKALGLIAISDFNSRRYASLKAAGDNIAAEAAMKTSISAKRKANILGIASGNAAGLSALSLQSITSSSNEDVIKLIRG